MIVKVQFPVLIRSLVFLLSKDLSGFCQFERPALLVKICIYVETPCLPKIEVDT